MPRLSVMIPLYDDMDEVRSMIDAVSESFGPDAEYFVPDLGGDGCDGVSGRTSAFGATCFRSKSLPAAKNATARRARAPYLLFLLPGLFPVGDAVLRMMARLDESSGVGAVAGRWENATGKLEVGYNVRRFPTLVAMELDILLLNKVFPGNASSRKYKMHDFDHSTSIAVDHANDCAFLLRRDLVEKLGGFDEAYAPGWFDQVAFCQSMNRAGNRVLFEPAARFRSNARVPLIDRVVEHRYPDYRRAELLYIRRNFGPVAELSTRITVALGMLGRLAFLHFLPGAVRRWFISTLHSYVTDDYVLRLRSQYWKVLRETLGRRP